MSDFRHETSLAVRYRDLDTWGHVNNAVYVSYLEHARVSYLDDVLDADLDDNSMVVANLTIDYKRPVTLRDEVTVAIRVSHLGTSSHTMEYELRSNGEVAATAETTQVMLDAETGKPRPIDDETRETVARFEGLD